MHHLTCNFCGQWQVASLAKELQERLGHAGAASGAGSGLGLGADAGLGLGAAAGKASAYARAKAVGAELGSEPWSQPDDRLRGRLQGSGRAGLGSGGAAREPPIDTSTVEGCAASPDWCCRCDSSPARKRLPEVPCSKRAASLAAAHRAWRSSQSGAGSRPHVSCWRS